MVGIYCIGGNKNGRWAIIWVILILDDEQYEENLITRCDGVRPRNDDRRGSNKRHVDCRVRHPNSDRLCRILEYKIPQPPAQTKHYAHKTPIVPSLLPDIINGLPAVNILAHLAPNLCVDSENFCHCVLLLMLYFLFTRLCGMAYMCT